MIVERSPARHKYLRTQLSSLGSHVATETARKNYTASNL